MPSIATHIIIVWSVHLYVSSVTLVHPAKDVGQNEMPLGRDTHMVKRNTVLERGRDPPREGEIPP